MRALLVLSTTLTAAMLSTAHAADWTGLYVGAGLGADAVTGEIDAVTPVGSGRAEGLGGGDIGLSVRLGADYQANQWLVIGAFANLDWSNVETSATFTDGVDSVSAQLLKLNYAWTIGARAGVLLTPSLMAYGLVGYTRVDLDEPSISDTASGQTLSLNLPRYDGITFGGGFEHRLSSRLSLTGEYRQSRFDKEVLFEDPGNIVVRGAPTLHIGRVGVAWRFGGGAEELPAAAVPPGAWQGITIGAGLGVDAMTRDLSADAAGIGSGKLEGLGGGDVGGTLALGYDQRVGERYVLGLFALVDWSPHETTVSGSALRQSVSADLLSIDYSWTIGARAGTLVASDVLAYVLAGYTQTTFDDPRLSAAGRSITLPFPNFSGFTIGGGFEKLLNDNLSLRAEYRYTALGEEALVAVPGVATLTMDPSMHAARLMLNYRFNSGG